MFLSRNITPSNIDSIKFDQLDIDGWILVPSNLKSMYEAITNQYEILGNLIVPESIYNGIQTSTNNAELLSIIDEMIRAKKDISEILKITNKKILKENFNFSNADVALADSIWRKLSKRRLNRGGKLKST